MNATFDKSGLSSAHSLFKRVAKAFEDIDEESFKAAANKPKAAPVEPEPVKATTESKEAEATAAPVAKEQLETVSIPELIRGIVTMAFTPYKEPAPAAPEGTTEKQTATASVKDTVTATVAKVAEPLQRTVQPEVKPDTMMVVLADGSVNPEFVATHSQTETVAALNAHYDKVEAEERAAAGAPAEAVTASIDPVASFDGVLQDSVSKLATRFGNRTNKNRRNKGE